MIIFGIDIRVYFLLFLTYSIAGWCMEVIGKLIEKKKIENALTCLDIIETDFFNLFYNSKSKNNMKYISIKMHMDRSYLYTFREKIVHKIIGMLYPTYDDLPLLK